VFAGARYADSTQGVVIVRRLQYPSFRQLTLRVITPSAHEGAFRIVGAMKHKLLLRTKTQKDMTFDADVEAFESP